MPNYIRNKLIIIGSEADIKTVIDNCKSIDDDGDKIAMDFNKIIPMPKSLDIEASNWLEEGMKYLMEKAKSQYEADNEFISKFESYPEDRQQKCVELGRQGLANIAQHDAPTWYEWSRKHWGTKWNACHSEQTDNAITFETAWNGVTALMVALSKKFPNVSFEYSYADENTAYNCGKYKIAAGRIISEVLPDGGSKEAYELYFELHPEDRKYYEFTDGQYRYKEDEA